MDPQTREKVIAHIKQMTTWGKKIPIADATEIYYDLYIYGDDLYELVIWLRKEFGVQTNINLREYGRREGLYPILFRKWRRRRERERRPYRSLKISDILKVIEAGHWP
jgi:hypothetical protein